ncbi:MAG: hypothetical protein IJG48_03550 [Mogibacterium sp.]|nr:hypothetical protein [Mogibacterium sp.]
MVTELVAIIGCITGVASLTLNLIRSWNERFDVRVHFFEPENIFFKKLSSYKSYSTDYHGLLRIRFENRSATPITVFSIHATINGDPLHFRKFEGYNNSFDIHLTDSVIAKVEISREIELPLRIEPYDACEGYLFIPFFPSINEDHAFIKLEAETTKRNVSAVSTIRFKGIRD